MDNGRAIRSFLAPVFAALARRNASEVDAASAVSVYVRDLSDLPVDAIEAVCADFRRGVLGDGVWCPTSAQIRQEALKVAERLDRIRPPSDALRIPDEREMRKIRTEAHKIAAHAGLKVFEAKAEWVKFVASFRALGPTKLRWQEEWAKHCANVTRPPALDDNGIAPAPRSHHEVDA